MLKRICQSDESAIVCVLRVPVGTLCFRSQEAGRSSHSWVHLSRRHGMHAPDRVMTANVKRRTP